MNKDRTRDFLEELSELTRKYEIVIEACGCCNSPWLSDLRSDKVLAQLITWDKESQKYEPYEQED